MQRMRDISPLTSFLRPSNILLFTPWVDPNRAYEPSGEEMSMRFHLGSFFSYDEVPYVNSGGFEGGEDEPFVGNDQSVIGLTLLIPWTFGLSSGWFFSPQGWHPDERGDIWLYRSGIWYPNNGGHFWVLNDEFEDMWLLTPGEWYANDQTGGCWVLIPGFWTATHETSNSWSWFLDLETDTYESIGDSFWSPIYDSAETQPLQHGSFFFF